MAYSKDTWTCMDCGGDLDGLSITLCIACSDRRMEGWWKHQEWHRMGPRQREEAIQSGEYEPGMRFIP